MKEIYFRLFPPVEIADEETVVEDDSELLLERIEEEMVADEMDSEDDEDILFNVDDLNKVIIWLRLFEINFSFRKFVLHEIYFFNSLIYIRVKSMMFYKQI